MTFITEKRLCSATPSKQCRGFHVKLIWLYGGTVHSATLTLTALMASWKLYSKAMIACNSAYSYKKEKETLTANTKI